MRVSFLKSLLVGSVAILAIPAAAATVDLSKGANNKVVTSKTFIGSDGTKVNVTAFSIDTANKIQLAGLGLFSGGLGAQYTGDTSHTVDNNGWKDFLLLSFDNYVKLSQISITTNFKYNNNTGCLCDSDATLGAAYPIGLPWNANLSFLGGTTFNPNSMTFMQADTSSTKSAQVRDVNANQLGGTLWLVGASMKNVDAIDGFKLKGLTYQVAAPPPPPVPEPATWAMLIIGMGGVGAAMRRRKAVTLAHA